MRDIQRRHWLAVGERHGVATPGGRRALHVAGGLAVPGCHKDSPGTWPTAFREDYRPQPISSPTRSPSQADTALPRISLLNGNGTRQCSVNAEPRYRSHIINMCFRSRFLPTPRF